MSTDLFKLRTKKLGLILLDARKVSGKPIKECAASIGISNHRLHLYERGELSPSLPELEAYAFFLDMPVSHLLGEKFMDDIEDSSNPTTIDQFKEVRQRLIATSLKISRSKAGLTLNQLAEKTGISSSRLKRYETGKTPVPIPELERVLSALGELVENFLSQSGKVGQWRKRVSRSEEFFKLPEDVQEFVCKPVNAPFLMLAQKLSSMSADKLRQVAEGLLEITY